MASYMTGTCAQLLQSCLTLGNPTDCLPGSSVHGILQEYWSGLPCPPPGDLPSPGIEPMSPANAGDPGDTGLIPGLGRFPEGGNGNPL